MTGRSIRLYLVDGEASGLLTSEVMNWSDKMLVAPRTKLAPWKQVSDKNRKWLSTEDWIEFLWNKCRGCNIHTVKIRNETVFIWSHKAYIASGLNKY